MSALLEAAGTGQFSKPIDPSFFIILLCSGFVIGIILYRIRFKKWFWQR